MASVANSWEKIKRVCASSNTKFVVIGSYLSFDNDLPFWKALLIKTYYNLKGIGVREDVNYGLDTSNVVFEKYPLVYDSGHALALQRLK